MKSIILTDQEAHELQEFYFQELEKTQRKLNHLQGILGKLEIEEVSEKPQKPAKVPSQKALETVVETETLLTEVAEPKKRGRKKKVVDIAEVSEPKRRGRPKLEKPVDENPSEPKKRGRKKIERPVDEVPSEPKKRGRKKKEILPETDGIDQPAKKRGRPKRILLDENGNVISKGKAKPKKRGRKKIRKSKKSSGKSPARANWTQFVLDTMIEFSKPFSSRELLMLAVERLGIPDDMFDKSRMSIAACLSNLASKRGKVKIYSVPDSKTQVYALPQWFDESGELGEDYVQRISK